MCVPEYQNACITSTNINTWTHKHLVLVEHIVGNVDDLLHMDDAAKALDINISQHSEHQDCLHKQLPVLRLRHSVQYRLHMHSKLNLTWCHLETTNKDFLVCNKASLFYQCICKCVDFDASINIWFHLEINRKITVPAHVKPLL